MNTFRKDIVSTHQKRWIVAGVSLAVVTFALYNFTTSTERGEPKTVQVTTTDVTAKPPSKCCVTKKVTVCHELKSVTDPDHRPFTHCSKGIELVECKNHVLNQNGDRFCLQKIPLSDEVELTHLSECLNGC
jgi:hypothetical protein